MIVDDGHVCTFEPQPTADSIFWYYQNDHLGSSSVITDRSGVLVKQYGYKAYGDQRYSWEKTASMNLSNRFTGQILDEDTGLYYYGARYYDAQLGRFVQPDPVIPGDPTESSQVLNRYTYALNNPLKFTDPTGNEPDDQGRIFQEAIAGSNVYKGSGNVVQDHMATIASNNSGQSTFDMGFQGTGKNGDNRGPGGHDGHQWAHISLDALGAFGDSIPGLGTYSVGAAGDGLNAAIYGFEGDKRNATYSALGAATPFSALLMKSGVKVIRLSGDVADAVKVMKEMKAAENTAKVAEKVAKTENSAIKAEEKLANKELLHGNNLSTTKPAEGYSLRDNSTGQLLKYGDTTRNKLRYSQKTLEGYNAQMGFEASGTKREMHEWQHQKILEYKSQNNGARPPLNKTDW